MRGSWEYNRYVCLFGGVLLFGLGALAVDPNCQPDLVQHINNGQSVWCVPIFNCGPNAEIVNCTAHGRRDECRLCDAGDIQPEMTSSLEAGLYPCFTQTPTHMACPGDTTATVALSTTPSCPMFCRCRYEGCYFGSDPCICSLQTVECDIGQTLNHETGECEACPSLTYKLETGCGRCLINETAWRSKRLSTFNCSAPEVTEITRGPDELTTTQSTKLKSSTTSQSHTEQTRHQNGSTESSDTQGDGYSEKEGKPNTDSTTLITVIAVLAACLVLAIVAIFAIVWYCRNKENFTPRLKIFNTRKDQTRLKESPSNEQAPLTSGGQTAARTDGCKYDSSAGACSWSSSQQETVGDPV